MKDVRMKCLTRPMRASLPVWETVTLWLAMDHLGTSPFWRGIWWTLCAFFWVFAVFFLVASDAYRIKDEALERDV